MVNLLLRQSRWILLVCAIVAAPVALAQNLSDEWVRSMASPLVENNVVDGLSIGYIVGDVQGVVHLGQTNDAGQPPHDQTIYELGSISKVMTGILLADAVVREKIRLDANPNIPNAAGLRLPSLDQRSISWMDLSTHRSGLPRLPANLNVTSIKNPYSHYDSSKAATALATRHLPRRPGQTHEYSNFAVSVLGYLIAENTGSTYAELLQERIARPLGMVDCTIELSDEQRQRFATPHRSIGSPTEAWDFADMPGAGGVRASIADMMRFANAQLQPPTGRIGEAIELAWEEHVASDASGNAMGLGWIIQADGETRWHNGGTGGTRTMIMVNRASRAAVIVLCNTRVQNEIDDLATRLLEKAAGG